MTDRKQELEQMLQATMGLGASAGASALHHVSELAREEGAQPGKAPGGAQHAGEPSRLVEGEIDDLPLPHTRTFDHRRARQKQP